MHVAAARPARHLPPAPPAPPVDPLRKLRLPLAFAVLLGVVYASAYGFAPDGAGPTSTPALRWLLAVSMVAVGVVAVQAVRFFALDILFLRSQGHRAPALLHVVVAIVLYFLLGLLIASRVFEQPLTGAIATSAVASVVLGLALQETLGNFFAGIALQIEQPFRFGDVVRVGELSGRVEAFNWRATTILTVHDSHVVIPNSLMAREAVEVFGRKEVNRRLLAVPAPYAVPPQRMVEVVRNALVGVPGVSERPAPQVRLAAFDDSSISYEVVYWVEDYLRGSAIDALIRERVWYAFARNGIAIPFPHEIQVPYEPPPPPTTRTRSRSGHGGWARWTSWRPSRPRSGTGSPSGRGPSSTARARRSSGPGPRAARCSSCSGAASRSACPRAGGASRWQRWRPARWSARCRC